MRRILIIDDDQTIHLALKYTLKSHFECVSAYDSEEAKIQLSVTLFDLIILDMNMRYENEGLKFLPEIRTMAPDTDVIVVSANTEKDLVKIAMERGASAWLVKDFSPEQLHFTIESVLQKRALQKEAEHHRLTRERTLSKNQLIGGSKAMGDLNKIIEKVRKSSANVLISGETGTGKELVARHLAYVEGRPFVAVDSSTITSSMAESILFGHEKGSFTGATTGSKGLFEEANGGTVYFDEIGNMPLEIQSKLLRVMQEKEVTRVGSRKSMQLDFRVICATNRDLEKMAADGTFKYDLLQRINVIPIVLPPLRDRKEDIPHLVQHFLETCRSTTSPSCFSEEALNALCHYEWPGNVRELGNVVTFLCTMVDGREAIEVEDLPQKVLSVYRQQRPGPKELLIKVQLTDVVEQFIQTIETTGEADYYGYLHEIEGKLVAALHSKYNANITKLCKAIKMSRSHLYAKLNEYGIASK